MFRYLEFGQSPGFMAAAILRNATPGAACKLLHSRHQSLRSEATVTLRDRNAWYRPQPDALTVPIVAFLAATTLRNATLGILGPINAAYRCVPGRINIWVWHVLRIHVRPGPYIQDPSFLLATGGKDTQQIRNG